MNSCHNPCKTKLYGSQNLCKTSCDPCDPCKPKPCDPCDSKYKVKCECVECVPKPEYCCDECTPKPTCSKSYCGPRPSPCDPVYRPHCNKSCKPDCKIHDTYGPLNYTHPEKESCHTYNKCKSHSSHKSYDSCKCKSKSYSSYMVIS
jgi:hypothetical protein